MINDFFKVQNWYEKLKKYTFPTWFVPLDDAALEALKQGCGPDDPAAVQTVAAMRAAMKNIPGNSFVFTDSCAPDDTERFYGKRGAVYSAESAWHYLAVSDKIRQAATDGRVSCIALRPFRRMSRVREFRLFIRNGELAGASQYNLIRYFHRLDKNRGAYWKRMTEFFEKIKQELPECDMTMDVYLTSSDEVLIIDFNPWGDPTDPLLFRTWERDWSEPAKLEIIEAPWCISGEVNVSF